MKKAFILLLLLPLLTGCWDRLDLKKLHLVDVNGFDLNEKTDEVEAFFLITKLKSTGQGTGEAHSEMKELKGPTLAEAIGQWEYTDQSPFIGISTRVYLMSKSFASSDPVAELDFLLGAPYSSINTPLIVIDGDLSKVFETASKPEKEFSKDLNEFIVSMEKNKTIPTVSMMNFIQSKDDPLCDLALPMLSPINSDLELNGALLYRNGKPTGKTLDRDQVKLMMLLEGGNTGRQRFTGNWERFTGNISGENGEKSYAKNANKNNFGFTVKRNFSKITVSNESKKLPKIEIKVKLQVSAFELGNEGHKLKPDYVQMEKVLSKHFEKMALETIKTMQSANSDALGIGEDLKALHPNVWKSLNWRKDYPRMTIEPKIDIDILNT
ncbi:Ger(x)C family spore germination C-terminal domain-containing protein [Bacillus sp. AFS017336]|uniref:Ger(x)C family spore germination protein n=1 Tax=Bacillus sp. AFS017336 TaxID=2033489 RepID=UPI000BF221D5|nr:Ger(x)C family spore germination C-terminal domain-containing protein [Bacillus sp. AFS017336]PEL13422.1 spore gernimation protein GerC [Bacillus sp. AFS017336]